MPTTMNDAIVELQVKLSFQEDLTAKLNQAISNQQQQIARLELALQILKEQTHAIIQGEIKQDERPPHY